MCYRPVLTAILKPVYTSLVINIATSSIFQNIANKFFKLNKTWNINLILWNSIRSCVANRLTYVVIVLENFEKDDIITCIDNINNGPIKTLKLLIYWCDNGERDKEKGRKWNRNKFKRQGKASATCSKHLNIQKYKQVGTMSPCQSWWFL